MSLSFNKKGYFFIIDALIAMTILTVGFFILLSFFIKSPPQNQAMSVNADLVNFLSTIQLRDYTETGTFLDRSELLLRGSLDNTLAEQILEFWYLENYNCMDPNSNATHLASDVIENVVPVQFDVLLKMNDCIIYERSISDSSEADLLIPSKSYIMTVYENSIIVGPHLMEVFVWQ